MKQPIQQSGRRIANPAIGARERALRNRMLKQVIGLMLLATVLSIVHVWSRMQVLNARYAITAVQQRIERLSKTVTRVESMVAALQSADRLTRVAREELGLSAPASGQVVVVKERIEETGAALHAAPQRLHIAERP